MRYSIIIQHKHIICSDQKALPSPQLWQFLCTMPFLAINEQKSCFPKDFWYDPSDTAIDTYRE
jgi:hypothetical protein